MDDGNIQCAEVGWPSGLRRYVQVVVFSEAWVRILPDAHCVGKKKKIFFFVSLTWGPGGN